MIFARRALQIRLDELRLTLADTSVDKLVAQLNTPGRSRMAFAWETAVLHALTKAGVVRNEVELSNGRRPDVTFDDGSLRYIADITTVSDDGLDELNPYFELSELIEKEKKKLGLPIGGLDIQVHSQRKSSAKGVQTVLRLPPRARMSEFVKTEVMPRLREQMVAGLSVLRLSIDDADIGVEISIDPAKSPISSGGFAAYDVPTIKTRNPLYNAFKSKVDQLSAASGLTGVIACDGDCAAITKERIGGHGVSAASIAEEFLRQYSSVGFVLLLTVIESRQGLMSFKPAERRIGHTLVVRPGCAETNSLSESFAKMLQALPLPVEMPVNGARRAREKGYNLGNHGGYCMASTKIRMSSRELVEVLAGLRTLDDNGALNIEASRKMPGPPSKLQAAFLSNLQHGRMPVTIDIVKGDENSKDDWIEFEFGDPDPAISPFR